MHRVDAAPAGDSVITLRASNVNEALPRTLRLLLERGVRRDSRNGPVIMAPEPVTIVTERPQQRVLFWAARDANTYFHLCEALWMIAGRRDVDFPSFFVPRMRDYSDNGVTFHGAYGHRWRKAFGVDQLGKIVEGLRGNPDCRRQALQFWDASLDLGRDGKDLPCNTMATVQINVDGALELTVFQRSGDLIWGVLGANAVHLSVLQEYLAGAAGVPIGPLRQVVVNLHAYLDTLQGVEHLASARPVVHYAPAPFPLGVTAENREDFDEECGAFCDWESAEAFRLPFFREVAVPLRDAYRAYKDCEKPEAFEAARELLEEAAECDWRRAAEEWIDRREQAWAKQE